MALAAIDYNQITVGQPTDGGCVYVSFKQADLPTDATTDADTLTGYESLGDISENGMTLGQSLTSNDFKDWHGDVVLSSISEDKKTIKLEFLETSRASVAKLRYGSDNVTVDESGVVTAIHSKPAIDQKISLFVDELESTGFLRRMCFENVKIESIDDESHVKNSLLVFGVTFKILVGSDGKDLHIYRAKPATA